jgi:hypothetical protein
MRGIGFDVPNFLQRNFPQATIAKAIVAVNRLYAGSLLNA